MTGAAFILIALATQAPARDTAIAAATGTARSPGTIVTDGQPSRPVRRAIVTVNSSDRVIGRTAVTDDSGRFLWSRTCRPAASPYRSPNADG